MALWKCPKCGKVVNFKDSKPQPGITFCSKIGKQVTMEKVNAKEE